MAVKPEVEMIQAALARIFQYQTVKNLMRYSEQMFGMFVRECFTHWVRIFIQANNAYKACE